MTEQDQKQVEAIVERVVSRLLGKPLVATATEEERAYLEERGWMHVAANPVAGLPEGFCDMSPPPDRKMVVGKLTDPRTGHHLRDVTQVVTGGSVGQHHTLAAALEMERKREREPLPVAHVAETSGNPPYDQERYPINLQKWVVRDRQRRQLAGPFQTKDEAESKSKELQGCSL